MIFVFLQSIIYFLISHDSLDDWLVHSSICAQLETYEQAGYVEIDPTFGATIDDDYDTQVLGLTRAKFYEVYSSWIAYCCEERKKAKGKVSCIPYVTDMWSED